ncbi:type II toxin-antitoxin system HicA family toxin [Geovibrio ferrireducens]|uniref:type II toxin-antitoxin system HicA family toxin n=1 Tax=Geovibrio ferrireducens TaxID=46201 RepID=UPI0038990738
MQNISAKHRKTLNAVFHLPVKSNIIWQDVEALFTALGAEVTEGSGSRVRIYLNGVRAVFHRPHPEKERNKGAVKSVQRFLTEAGVKDAGI